MTQEIDKRKRRFRTARISKCAHSRVLRDDEEEGGQGARREGGSRLGRRRLERKRRRFRTAHVSKCAHSGVFSDEEEEEVQGAR